MASKKYTLILATAVYICMLWWNPCQAFVINTETPRRSFSLTRLYADRQRETRRPFLTRLNADTEKKQLNLQSGYDTTDGYDSFLISPKKKRRNQRLSRKIREEMDEDGYASMMEGKMALWQKALFLPWRLSARALKKMTGRIPEPGTLILVRHGESKWNANKTFTGWADPDLSEQGVREVEHAARLLIAGGYDIDVVFTSRLKRAIRSAWIVLMELNQLYIPVFKSWRLNERMYGALTGLCKKETAEQLGSELVQSWRGSLASRPPSLTPSDTYWPGRDRRYSDLKFDQIPLTESLLDCMERTEPAWEDKIKVELRMGRTVLVVAHANTLRGLVKLIDGIGDEEIQEVAIPTGIPIIYKFDRKMNPVKPEGKNFLSQQHMTGVFLEKPGELKTALLKEMEWREFVPGYNQTMSRSKTAMTSVERALSKLMAEKQLKQWAGQFVDPNDSEEDDGSDGNMGKPIQLTSQDQIWQQGLKELEQGEQFNPEISFHPDGNMKILEDEVLEEIVSPSIITNSPCLEGMPSESIFGIGPAPIRRDPVVVLIRHGKTEHNKLSLFTGWEDAPLAQEGREEARLAGKLLKAHGFEFDVVYTSWLSRAIETAWLVMDEMDAIWLPIIKTWRLNERMYGSLTGKSKQMVSQRYGEKQFKAWRRGYTVRPPPVSSFSVHYPGNDPRYKLIKDIRYSVSESIMRSFDSRKIMMERKLPKSESLKDCMDRTIPYYERMVVPEAIDKGKRVLISSSENAIRGLLMFLCEIPEEKISELEIPNGLPLIYDPKSKCIKLLDDGSGLDPLEVYNFGNAANYLFRPCRNEDGEEEECNINLMFDNVYKLTAEDQNFVESLRAIK
jgi:2,3-bisphosphoglycerate-dependent phosphoglycerate mutase